MTYTVLTGRFVIRYPDLPRQGPEPDGDTVKFAPDTPGLVEGLARPSGTPPDLGARGISVRLEAIDALETHFAETHQDLAGANAARDELLRLLGFTGVEFFDDLPNNVRAADQDSVRGHVLSNGIDANGRMIGFVYLGEPAAPDGSTVFLDEAGADGSANALLLAAGLAYPAFYATLPASLRTHLATMSRKARADGAGIWTTSTADPAGAATVTGLADLRRLAIWPKLFRRIVPYLATGATGFDGFGAWLRSDPVNRDDSLFLLDRLETGNLHDVVEAAGQRIRMTAWPEDFIIDPDPAAPGTPTTPPRLAAGDVLIVAALPDPVGADDGHELLTLLNTTAAGIDLTGWTLRDRNGRSQSLSGTLAAGAVTQVAAAGVALGNTGGTVTLADALGSPIDQVSYRAAQVKEGRTIVLGR
ncbi:lamin tail domain-containing protein [Pseudosporangium ferrugineum]|uniref:Lamin tail-like protein n=1 Tax=Pseudosporangium ferrugineum TaxID=439699 RepID=A0A2T0RLC9_9ACTN|nr:lamin tail domain-containing protein [Pseudosporangium ferrugineum]PRY21994.1 lamin tail-like protein [Pseudosporangium ferrugineum]